MVDEFQDAGRAGLGLSVDWLSQPGRYLLAVGDDWQSINRFAGADISVMTGLSGLVREEPAALPDDHLSLYAGDLRRRPPVRVQEPEPVRQTDALPLWRILVCPLP